MDPVIIAAGVTALGAIIIALINRRQNKRDELLVATLTRHDETMIKVAEAVGGLKQGQKAIAQRVVEVEKTLDTHGEADRRGFQWLGVPQSVLVGDTFPH